MKKDKKGLILMVVGLITALVAFLGAPLLGYIDPQIIMENAVLFIVLRLSLIVIGLVIAGYGEYIRR